jgi:putative phage-type endonuclease
VSALENALGIDAEIICEDITAIPREQWLALRKEGIGGSDAAAALGLSKWTSPLALYYDKTRDEINDEDNERFEWGRRNEATIADGFAARNPDFVVENVSIMLRSARQPFMVVNIDRFMTGSDGEHTFLECKNVDARSAHEWKDGPPLQYRLQVQHGMYVCGPMYRRCFIAALIGGNALTTFEVLRDEELIASLIAGEERFWTQVQLRRPPEPDGSESSRKALAEHFAAPTLDAKEVNADFLVLLDQHASAKSLLDAAKERLTAIENLMKVQIGEAEAVTVNGEIVATWKSVTRKEYTVAENTYRKLDVKRKREDAN